MKRLDELENEAMQAIVDAHSHYKDLALLWSGGKDSTTLLWLASKTFDGRIPFPVIYLETGHDFEEALTYRDEKAREWLLNLKVAKNMRAENADPEKDKADCCRQLKVEALREAAALNKLDGALTGARTGDDGPFSAGEELDFIKLAHPLAGWSELDVWKYIYREEIPVLELYFSSHGKRYVGVSCKSCVKQVESKAGNVEELIEELEAMQGEDGGGGEDDEIVVARLKSLGYM
jgi:sulfate adenylyltransferase subunit 2